MGTCPGAQSGAWSGTGPPEGTGQRWVKKWTGWGAGGRRSARPGGRVAAPPVRAPDGYRILKDSPEHRGLAAGHCQRPRGAVVAHERPEAPSSSEARGKVDARGTETPGRGGKRNWNQPPWAQTPRPPTTPSWVQPAAAQHMQTSSLGWTQGQRSWHCCQNPAPGEGAPSKRHFEGGVSKGD